MKTQKSHDIPRSESILLRQSVENILLSIESKAEANEQSLESISEEVLTLSDILGEVVERALDLIDNNPIKLIRDSQTGREIFEIKGETGSYYRLFPQLPYCCCRSFHNQVIRGEEHCCKHYIATRIAKALGKVEVIEKKTWDFRKDLKQIQF